MSLHRAVRCGATLFAITAVLLLGSQSAKADNEKGIRSVSLAEALNLAREQHPSLKISSARIEAQKAQSSIPLTNWYPTIGATGQLFAATSNNWTGTFLTQRGVDTPRIGSTRANYPGTFEPYASSFVALSINQPLYDFGRWSKLQEAENSLVDVERARQQNDQLGVLASVEDAYYAVLTSKAILKVSEEAVSRSKTHRDSMAAMVQEKLRAPIDLTRAEADLARFEASLQRAKASVRLSQIALASAVGSTDSELDAKDDLVANVTTTPLPQALETLNNHPRIKVLSAMVEAEKKRTEAIAAEARPFLFATASISGRAGGAKTNTGDVPYGAGFIPYVPNYDLGIVLTVPFYDPTISARKQANMAREWVRREELLASKYDLELGARQAYTTIEIAQSAIPALQHSLDAAMLNYSAAEARLKERIGNSIELADAEALRLDAEVQLAIGKLQVARAKSQFERRIGKEPTAP